jgi:UDP:flavonoid glycosyltransferase YjiC (YdhE family)
MRVLLACSLGPGHLTPVVNVARALGRLGHDAVVLIPPSLVTEIEREGLPYEVGGEPPRAVIEERWERVRGGPAWGGRWAHRPRAQDVMAGVDVPSGL